MLVTHTEIQEHQVMHAHRNTVVSSNAHRNTGILVTHTEIQERQVMHTEIKLCQLTHTEILEC
jgi:hypothetical protein